MVFAKHDDEEISDAVLNGDSQNPGHLDALMETGMHLLGVLQNATTV